MKRAEFIKTYAEEKVESYDFQIRRLQGEAWRVWNNMPTHVRRGLKDAAHLRRVLRGDFFNMDGSPKD